MTKSADEQPSGQGHQGRDHRPSALNGHIVEFTLPVRKRIGLDLPDVIQCALADSEDLSREGLIFHSLFADPLPEKKKSFAIVFLKTTPFARWVARRDAGAVGHSPLSLVFKRIDRPSGGAINWIKRMKFLVGEERMDRIEFQLNGQPVKLKVEGDRKLLWVLRTDLSLPGTKYACGKGLCGACTVLIDEEAQRSCQLPIREVAGKKVLTIEGLVRGEKLHPLQKAFLEHNAFQCGFCTPGMILNAYGLLNKNSHPSESEILQAMDGNLCRCGAHPRIVAAVQTAAREIKEKKG